MQKVFTLTEEVLWPVRIIKINIQFSSVTQSCPTLCDSMDCSTPGLPVHHQLPEFTQTHVHWVSHAIQPSHPLSSPFLPTFNLSQHQGLFKESVLCIRWPKYWSFSFNISPSKEHPGLISFRMDWLDLLAVQGTLKSLLQHHSSNTSIVSVKNYVLRIFLVIIVLVSNTLVLCKTHQMTQGKNFCRL